MPGICVTIAAWTLIDFDQPQRGLLKRFDWLGLAGMAAFLGSLEYVLEEGTRLDWFESHEIVFFTVVMVAGRGAVLLAGADAGRSARRPARLHRPQLRLRLAVLASAWASGSTA